MIKILLMMSLWLVPLFAKASFDAQEVGRATLAVKNNFPAKKILEVYSSDGVKSLKIPYQYFSTDGAETLLPNQIVDLIVSESLFQYLQKNGNSAWIQMLFPNQAFAASETTTCLADASGKKGSQSLSKQDGDYYSFATTVTIPGCTKEACVRNLVCESSDKTINFNKLVRCSPENCDDITKCRKDMTVRIGSSKLYKNGPSAQYYDYNTSGVKKQ